MNERIKALAIEAGGGPSKWYNDPAVLEKFVELIVRECAEIGYDSVNAGHSTDFLKHNVRNNIRNNFGVEE